MISLSKSVKPTLIALAVLGSLSCGGGGGGDGGGGPAATYSVSGTVSGDATEGVTIELTGKATGSVDTKVGGTFTFPELANGSYTLTPSLEGYTFAPTSRAVSVSGANVTGRNFTATAATGVWTPKASMTTARSSLASAVVGGSIYVMGGINYDINTTNGWLATNEAYNPVTNVWTPRAAMTTARQGLSAAAVNGVIYALGGDNVTSTCSTCNGFKPLATNEAYDVAGNSWSTKAPMAIARERFATAVVNGIVYAIGGMVVDNSVTPAFVKASPSLAAYDPVANSWSVKAPLATARFDVHAAALNGIIYAIGGSSNSAELLSVEAYDPVANTWTPKAALPAGNPVSSVDVVNGVLYVIRDYGAALTYNPTANSWTPNTAMSTSFYEFNRTSAVVDNTLFTIGGRDSFGAVDYVDAFKP